MKVIMFLGLLLFETSAFGQKFDYIWITGDDNQTSDTTYGGGILDFNFNPPKASYHYREQNMFTTNSSICDTARYRKLRVQNNEGWYLHQPAATDDAVNKSGEKSEGAE
jgi:hypothetical protein